MGRNNVIEHHREVTRIAIKRLDPNQTLVPGTQEYVDTEAMVTEWLVEYGPAQTLEMVTKCTRDLEGSNSQKKYAEL